MPPSPSQPFALEPSHSWPVSARLSTTALVLGIASIPLAPTLVVPALAIAIGVRAMGDEPASAQRARAGVVVAGAATGVWMLVLTVVVAATPL